VLSPFSLVAYRTAAFPNIFEFRSYQRLLEDGVISIAAGKSIEEFNRKRMIHGQV
jgi:hypothetical protein